jgi:hypothetical protein
MHPVKMAGRIVLGPRQVKNGYARIVSRPDGSGRIELFDAKAGVWAEALESCTFSEIWSSTPIFDMRYLSAVASLPD